ncbi:MAG TPA: hypothetical protein VK514_10910 [Candidatus Acidoferrum sp.]|nr:hypothetical protein [Candidatus Acidoferrum sp.]
MAAFPGVHNNRLVAKEIGHASGEPLRIIHVHLNVVDELIGLLDADLDLLVDLGIDERGIPAVVGENRGDGRSSSPSCARTTVQPAGRPITPLPSANRDG